MKQATVIFFILIFAQSSFSQDATGRKGDIYGYWGWNRGWYTNSDLHFKGDGYDFTVHDAVAKDRQSPFAFNLYFHPKWLTIPQYNIRVGYFYSDHYNLSIGVDHMKYVMQFNQIAKVSGNIDEGSSYDGTYDNTDLQIHSSFLQFEHTDGLNYGNLELRRFDEIVSFRKIIVSLSEGVSAGVLFPRTNTTLLNKERYDQFHVSGFGVAAVGAVNIEFLKYLFIQSEIKVGYMNMPKIRTTTSTSDKADQQFGFAQLNVLFGYRINPKKVFQRILK